MSVGRAAGLPQTRLRLPTKTAPETRRAIQYRRVSSGMISVKHLCKSILMRRTEGEARASTKFKDTIGREHAVSCLHAETERKKFPTLRVAYSKKDAAKDMWPRPFTCISQDYRVRVPHHPARRLQPSCYQNVSHRSAIERSQCVPYKATYVNCPV